jgi:hypothetical protein
VRHDQTWHVTDGFQVRGYQEDRGPTRVALPVTLDVNPLEITSRGTEEADRNVEVKQFETYSREGTTGEIETRNYEIE